MLISGLAHATTTAHITLTPQPAETAQQADTTKRVAPLASPDPARKASAALTFSSDHTFSGDFSDSEGDVSVTRGTGNFQMQFPLMERSQLGVAMSYSRWNFDFSDAAAFDTEDGDPWSGINEFDLTTTFSTQLTDKWSGVIGATVKSAYADGADFSDSLTAGGLAGATYKFSDKLSVGAGVVVRTQLEDDVMLLPLITVDWKITDTLSFSTVPSPGRRFLGLTYAPHEQWEFTAGAAFEYIDFRLDDEAPAPEGVGRYRRIPVGGGVTFKASQQVLFSLYGGVMLGQELTLDDIDGDRIEREQIDSAPLIGGSVTFSF